MKKGTNGWEKAACPLFLLGVLLLSGASAPGLAPPGTRERKFQRGLLNVAFAPAELSNELERVKREDHWLTTWIPAGFWGSVHMVIRAASGLYDVVTFFIPAPPEYRPILKPEFAKDYLEGDTPSHLESFSAAQEKKG